MALPSPASRGPGAALAGPVYTDIFRGLPEVVIILLIGLGHRADASAD